MVVECGRCFDAPLASLRASARTSMATGVCGGVSELAAHFRSNENC